MKYFPTPKIIAFFLLVLAAGFVGWFWFFYEKPQAQKQLFQAGPAQKPSSEWQEELKKLTSQSTFEPEAQELPTNFTEQVSRALSNSLGPRLLSGQGVSPEEVAQIQNYLPEPSKILGEVPEVKISGLKISDQNDKDSVKKYFNKLWLIYEKNFLVLQEDDLAIVARAFQTEDLSELEKIDPILLAFEKSISEIKKISVPKGWENFAIQELNYLLRTRRAVEVLRNAGIDPLSAMAVLQLRVNLMSEVNNFHQETKDELLRKGISFYAREGGYLLFQ